MGNKRSSQLGDHIRQARNGAGMSVKDVARLVNKEPNAVYRWEWGVCEPSLSDLRLMADAFGVSAGQLVDGAPSRVGRKS